MSKAQDRYTLSTLRAFLSVSGEVRSLLITLRQRLKKEDTGPRNDLTFVSDRLGVVEEQIRWIVEELK